MSAFVLYRIPSLPLALYTRGRIALVLAAIMIVLSLVSVLTGLAGHRYIYCVLTNLVPIFLPLLLREGTKGTAVGLDLLDAQCILGFVYFVLLLVLDSIVLSFVSTEYQYCEGSWSRRCQPFKGQGSIDFVCDSAAYGLTPEKIYISCETLDVYIMQFISLSVNLFEGVIMGPYLLVCLRMRFVLARYRGENGFLLELHTLTAKPAVLLGFEEELNEERDYPATGMPVTPKPAPNDCTDDSRDEALQSRSYLTVTHRSIIHPPATK